MKLEEWFRFGVIRGLIAAVLVAIMLVAYGSTTATVISASDVFALIPSDVTLEPWQFLVLMISAFILLVFFSGLIYVMGGWIVNKYGLANKGLNKVLLAGVIGVVVFSIIVTIVVFLLINPLMPDIAMAYFVGNIAAIPVAVIFEMGFATAVYAMYKWSGWSVPT